MASTRILLAATVVMVIGVLHLVVAETDESAHNEIDKSVVIDDADVSVIDLTSLPATWGVGTVEERLAAMETVLADMAVDMLRAKRDINEAQDDVSSAKHKINHIRDELHILQHDMSDLESDTRGDMGELREGLDDVNSRITTQDEVLLGLSTDITALEQSTLVLATRLNQSQSQDQVAFQATLTSYDPLSEGDVIKFNRVDMNHGKGYSAPTGIFTVPSGAGGLYYFSLSMLVSPSQKAEVQMRLNGNGLCTGIGDQDSSGYHDFSTASCSSVAEVQEGDSVYVYYVLGSYSSPFWLGTSIFNGFKL